MILISTEYQSTTKVHTRDERALQPNHGKTNSKPFHRRASTVPMTLESRTVSLVWQWWVIKVGLWLVDENFTSDWVVGIWRWRVTGSYYIMSPWNIESLFPCLHFCSFPFWKIMYVIIQQRRDVWSIPKDLKCVQPSTVYVFNIKTKTFQIKIPVTFSSFSSTSLHLLNKYINSHQNTTAPNTTAPNTTAIVIAYSSAKYYQFPIGPVYSSISSFNPQYNQPIQPV